MTKRIHGNNAVTILDGAITNVATSLTVIDSSNFPTIAAGESFRLTLQASTGEIEIVDVTDASLDPTFTVTRGMEGTTGFAFPDGSLVSLRTTKDSHDRKQDQIANSSDVIDFGAATSLEIPNSAAPVLTNSGEIALDNTVTDFADGLVKYKAGSTEYGVIAIPLSGLASPSNTYLITYDAAAEQFKLSAAQSAVSAKVTKSGVQSITTGTETTVTWDTESYDTNSIHDNSIDNSRLTLPIAGKYLLNAILDFTADANGIRQIILYKNGAALAAVIYPNNGAGNPVQAQLSVLDLAAVNSYYEIKVYQDSGSSLNIASSSLYYFSATLLGL